MALIISKPLRTPLSNKMGIFPFNFFAINGRAVIVEGAASNWRG